MIHIPATAAVARKRASGGVSYLFQENFPSSGTQQTWTTTAGTIDFANTSSPLEGDASCYLNAGTEEEIAYAAFGTDSQYTEIWCYFLMRVDAFPGTIRELFALAQDSTYSSTEAVRLSFNASNSPRIVHRSQAGEVAVGTMTTGTDYHCWLYYKASTGSNNGIIRFAWSTDGTKPTSGNNFVEKTNCNSTVGLGYAYLKADRTSGSGTDYRIDKIRIDTAEIGDNPS